MRSGESDEALLPGGWRLSQTRLSFLAATRVQNFRTFPPPPPSSSRPGSYIQLRSPPSPGCAAMVKCQVWHVVSRDKLSGELCQGVSRQDMLYPARSWSLVVSKAEPSPNQKLYLLPSRNPPQLGYPYAFKPELCQCWILSLLPSQAKPPQL